MVGAGCCLPGMLLGGGAALCSCAPQQRRGWGAQLCPLSILHLHRLEIFCNGNSRWH